VGKRRPPGSVRNAPPHPPPLHYIYVYIRRRPRRTGAAPPPHTKPQRRTANTAPSCDTANRQRPHPMQKHGRTPSRCRSRYAALRRVSTQPFVETLRCPS
jgi:hypothetical protein